MILRSGFHRRREAYSGARVHGDRFVVKVVMIGSSIGRFDSCFHDALEHGRQKGQAFTFPDQSIEES